MENTTCFICMSVDDPLNCDDLSCNCHVKIPTPEQACQFIGLLKQNATEPCHYIHTTCLFHYHKHNQGMYFTCPGCKHKIVATSPASLLFENLHSEQTKRYDHDEHVMELVLHTSFSLSIIDTHAQVITTLRQLCAIQHALPVMLDAFDILFYRLSCICNTYIIHTHAILFFIIGSPIDKTYKHELLKMLKKFGLELCYNNVLLDMLSYIRMFDYLQTADGWNELQDIINIYILPSDDKSEYCVDNVVKMLRRAYPNINQS